MKNPLKSLIGGAVMAIAVALPAVLHAEQSVVVVAADGTETVVTLADVQRIDIGAEGLTLHHAAGESSVAFADLDRVLIGAERAAVKDIMTGGDIAFWPTTTSTTVNVTGLAPGAHVTAHSLAGALVAAADADTDGNAVIDLTGAAGGVYIVSAADRSVKIIKN
ncbi:MAG: hypothetical protein Q4C34_06635 [Bacteroidales bacterium]|nr:hypothetical protein [Bacteroidales bacterium]